MISLKSFVVLKKLSVGNVRVEAKKVHADYTVQHFSGETDSCELIYSYDSPHFDASIRADVNLASMMLAQVALNYGLFCETLEFDGLFDDIDRKFLERMLENTSREILTNKLLIDNEFIDPKFKPLKAEKLSRHTQAQVVFKNSRFTGLPQDVTSEFTDESKYAILSSGGKDSLLTYGIIKEIAEPFPVFINEAGRHWFTAANSYKHFSKIEPNTEKPWCNSDRVFNWMLKQMPFIRKNYASVRSDIYPLRLWTVAVFLFGVLPIARKKKIGNVLIGNEYDTTIKVKTDGIEHYNGLYDQSKYFDNALTRYYRAKGWRLSQFSILRSMSELLILKMLAKRYPELQQHQVSCHAAHKVGDAMRPCGKCEKCRRIIGMLMALDADPSACGYTRAQINDGLKALENKSVKQIGSDVSHLFHLLLQKGLITKNQHTARLAQEHKEITNLRFDSERSCLEDLPIQIRKPLYSLLLPHSDGAVIRSNRRWQPVKIDENFLSSAPYTIG